MRQKSLERREGRVLPSRKRKDERHSGTPVGAEKKREDVMKRREAATRQFLLSFSRWSMLLLPFAGWDVKVDTSVFVPLQTPNYLSDFPSIQHRP